MEESGPTVEIKANAVAGAFQICGTTLEGNGYGDHPRTLGIRITDADKGTLKSWQTEWVDGTVLVSSYLTDSISESISSIWDFYGWHSLPEGMWWGRTTYTNQSAGTYVQGVTSEVCSNYFFSVLNGPNGDTNNVWHFDFLTRAADTVYRVFSGNVAESQTNTVVINVTGIDLASYTPGPANMYLTGSDWSYWDRSSFQAVDYTRISVRINGTTLPVDSSGNVTVDLPNDTKTEFKILVSPDSNGVIWAELNVSASSP